MEEEGEEKGEEKGEEEEEEEEEEGAIEKWKKQSLSNNEQEK